MDDNQMFKAALAAVNAAHNQKETDMPIDPELEALIKEAIADDPKENNVPNNLSLTPDTDQDPYQQEIDDAMNDHDEPTYQIEELNSSLIDWVAFQKFANELYSWDYHARWTCIHPDFTVRAGSTYVGKLIGNTFKFDAKDLKKNPIEKHVTIFFTKNQPAVEQMEAIGLPTSGVEVQSTQEEQLPMSTNQSTESTNTIKENIPAMKPINAPIRDLAVSLIGNKKTTKEELVSLVRMFIELYDQENTRVVEPVRQPETKQPTLPGLGKAEQLIAQLENKGVASVPANQGKGITVTKPSVPVSGTAARVIEFTLTCGAITHAEGCKGVAKLRGNRDFRQEQMEKLTEMGGRFTPCFKANMPVATPEVKKAAKSEDEKRFVRCIHRTEIVLGDKVTHAQCSEMIEGTPKQIGEWHNRCEPHRAEYTPSASRNLNRKTIEKK